MVPTFEDIVPALSTLNRSQLEQLRTRAAFLLQHSPRATIVDEDWLLTGVLSELRYRGLTDLTTFKIKNSTSFAGFQTRSENVRRVLLEGAPGLNAVERRALGELAAKWLAASLAEWTEVSLHSMLEKIGNIPAVIDAAFPGYMAERMLGIVIRRE